jgi:hypothetical protein
MFWRDTETNTRDAGATQRGLRRAGQALSENLTRCCFSSAQILSVTLDKQAADCVKGGRD